jgi:hypothetical protein
MARPVREIGCYRRLGKRARFYSVLSPPFGNRVQVSQHRDGPTKSVPTGRPGVADDATGTTIWTDHQLGVRAHSLPFERRWNGFYVLLGAEFVSELSDALGAILRDEDRDLGQPLRW